jgi:predicted Zn-dependent protease
MKSILLSLLLAGLLSSYAQTSYLNHNASRPEDTGGVARFLHYLPEDIPIEVHIPQPEGEEANPTAAETVRAALEAWQEAAEGLVSFDFVAEPGADSLEVRWQRLEPSAAGSYQYRWSITNGLYRFRTTSITLDPSRDEATLHRFALLQVGHALGLLGRSPYPGDAMSASPSGVVSERDVATLLFLYSLPSGTPAE